MTEPDFPHPYKDALLVGGLFVEAQEAPSGLGEVPLTAHLLALNSDETAHL